MDETALRLSVVILCKDEERTIGHCLEQIFRQTLFDRSGVQAEVVVVANSCTDRTADRARAFVPPEASRAGPRLKVVDLPQGGKSRSWNRAVHEFTATTSDYLLFLDSDIDLVDDTVIAKMVDFLAGNAAVAAYAGYPIKAIARKAKPSLIDRFSLLISRQTRHVNAINGSLYLIRGDEARSIWLPDETPGEDGFLNAMVKTRGFTQSKQPCRVLQAREPTHYFESHTPSQFFAHERRMFVGTIINRWLFEHLWSLRLTEPAGPLLRDWNSERPHWVQELIERNVRGHRWLIPREMLFGRFRPLNATGWARFIAQLPTALSATLLTVPPAIMANKALKQKGAASHW